MIPDELLLSLFMIASLTFYVLMGGADYGGGVWDLFAFGPRAAAQRKTIADAIGPIWEANHVWLILVIVILFSAFPAAFAQLTTVLHIPLTLILFGIVLRGSAFTFRTYDKNDDKVQKFWGMIFSISSLVTPILLGVSVGGISNGLIRAAAHGDFFAVYVNPWCQPFPFAVGIFALNLFAFLAAVYLTLDAKDPEVQEDFRRRALVSGVLLAFVAATVFFLAKEGASDIYGTLAGSWYIHLATGVTAIAALVALVLRKFTLARTCAAAQVTLILWGWGVAQYPYIIRPDFDIFNSSSHAVTLRHLLIALTVGAVFLFPSFWYLYKVFKWSKADPLQDDH